MDNKIPPITGKRTNWDRPRFPVRWTQNNRGLSPICLGLRVWETTDHALREVANVRVTGYSLPASDSAARALLNPLQSRANRGGVEVRVSDPNAEGRQRWRDLLGERVTIDDERLRKTPAPA